jgi:PAS domain S-box-containing protein
MLNKPDDIARLSSAELQKLLLELQARQLELEIQNQELRASLGCHEHLFEKSPIGELTLDKAGIVQRANNSAINLLGCAKQDIVGATLAAYVHPSDKQAYDHYLGKLVDTLTAQVVTLKLNTQNGNAFDVECRGSADITAENQVSISLALNNLLNTHKVKKNILKSLINLKSASVKKQNI